MTWKESHLQKDAQRSVHQQVLVEDPNALVPLLHLPAVLLLGILLHGNNMRKSWIVLGKSFSFFADASARFYVAALSVHALIALVEEAPTTGYVEIQGLGFSLGFRDHYPLILPPKL